jgi:hypothetical protein
MAAMISHPNFGASNPLRATLKARFLSTRWTAISEQTPGDIKPDTSDTLRQTQHDVAMILIISSVHETQ